MNSNALLPTSSMGRINRFLLGLILCCGLFAARNVPGAEAPAEPPVTLQYPNNPVGEILSFYELLTGQVLVRDAGLTGNLSIVATQPMTKSEAIRLIEAALLLNGYSLVPDIDNRIKVVSAAKNPRSEGVPLYANATALPQGNQVVSYFMQFRFLPSADAKNILTQHVGALHTYGGITEVPNAQALVITENASLIRQLINLQDLIDVPPAQVISQFVILQRADAERVADVITKLIESQKNDKQKQGQNAPAQPAPGTPGGPAAGNALFENELVAGAVQLIPDARTNRILVITRPVNFPYIKSLISEFDKEVGLSAPLERPLKYISAAEVLPVLGEILTENENGPSNGAGGQKGQAKPPSQAQNQSQNYSSAGQNGQTGANSHPDMLSEPEGDTGPTSLIVGKTRLIADNKANSILVIGAPESQEKVRTILDKLDRQPPQVFLSTVIGQLKLTKNNEFGVDYVKLFQAGGGTASHSTGIASSAISTANAILDPRTLTAAAAFPPTSGLALYGTIGKSISVFVHALESTNNFKVLSRPEIYTANNKKAVISSGARIPYPASTLSNLNTVNNVNNNNTAAVQSSIDYEDVDLKLEVVPLINANNEVNLKINQVNDTVAGSTTISGNTVPTISTQSINTTVTVPSGGTVVLGGLITESTTNNINGIPILMKLPWIGPLFRDTTKNTERDELIILIQPTVVQSNAEMLEASASEEDRARIGNKAYLFAQPPPPRPALEPFVPQQSVSFKK